MYNINKWEEVGMIYFGTYEHSLDAKNRLLIPSKLKDKLSKKIYLLKGFDGCLSLYDQTSFENLCNKLNSYSFNQSKEREYIRVILSSVVEMECDKIGRIQIPNNIINRYKIEKEISVIGVGDHIEIWNREKWNSYNNSSDLDFDEIAEGINNV